MFLVVKYSVNDAPFLVGFAVKAGSHVQRKYKHKKRTFEPGRRKQKQKRKGTISIFFCLRRYVIRVNRDNASKCIAQAHAPAQKKRNIFLSADKQTIVSSPIEEKTCACAVLLLASYV